MRHQTIMGRVDLMYPEEICFIHDRNIITLTYIAAGDNTVGGVFTLTNQQGETATLLYNSEQKYLTFNLLSTLKKMMNNDYYNVVTVSGSVICGETSEDITPFNIKCVDGRTLHSRGHNTERIIYYYDNSDLTGLEFLMLDGGTINFTQVQSGVVKQNLSNYTGDFTVNIVDGNVNRVVTVKKAVIGGDNGYSTGCGEDGDEGGGVDNSFGILKLRYRNTDGCQRFIQGKITGRKRTVGQQDWRADELVRHTPNAMITATTDEITVGFPDIARESYTEDIMYSPKIEYQREDGEWESCIIGGKSLTLKEWDTNEFEITFITLS